ncbi:MAG: RsmF rRNA methyltransferase first C-terminal domain-containing protein [Lachnospiraceae bacterium]|nr:RsmF rRNA methyltransferase first C-terminal domain-containing protein [Lachnospiraceae bacterium]
MTQLPQEFMGRMQDMLGEAYPAFLRSYEDEKAQALRVNALKGTKEEFLKKASFGSLREVPWEKNGLYYTGTSDCAPGKHPFHEAGVYYVQEPSAMAPAAYLEAAPGERVLDLCAAPGGKTTQIASCMQNQGILVCNEIHPARAKILSENVERMGIRNALVTNETPQRLAEVFDGYFDRILVDAPCSGEGMFRKSEEACAEWSPANVQLCADRQDAILDCADRMLRPGGRLVYSTCTFAPAENEGTIARFLERHSKYEILQAKKYDGMSAGVPAWAYDGMDSSGCSLAGIRHTIRLFPHLIQGEGHYLAVLQKQGEAPKGYQAYPANGLQKGINAKDVKEFLQFQQEALQIDLLEHAQDRLLRFGGQLYRMPMHMPSIDKLKVLRAGLHLGTLKKNRFEPSHALALSLKKDDVRRSAELETEEAARAYLAGITLNHDGEKGWYLMTYQGYSIGWGKLAGQVMKNHYPKGLRKV